MVVTPTCDRMKFLQQTYRYFRAQDYPYPENLFWCVLDDSKQRPSTLFHASLMASPQIQYKHHPGKLRIGRKRNLLNNMALEIGADIICAMDDDDWYGESYVREMVDLLMNSDFPMAGGSAIHYYVAGEDRILFFNRPFGPYHSCNNLLGYKTDLLKHTSYDDAKATGEEMAFTRHFKIPLVQHPMTKRVFLGLIHSANIVPKNFISQNSKFITDLRLEDFAMDNETKVFLRSITPIN
ncbi:glycosyltransferase family A protein [Kiloniella laminariae]|uniref:Glycosyltransferase family A protein n=1 Tax=Kiloniella laminariae TaxID=454162 RepID=A0ABT4LKV6_9PROT|nr:glycosyltransferase family A protein [Kiloniella laminariae]MCZ4280602.1 glycosyltransferase family A protein [Kiloniella laminariae]